MSNHIRAFKKLRRWLDQKKITIADYVRRVVELEDSFRGDPNGEAAIEIYTKGGIL